MGANMRRTANGDVDVLHAIGGWRGLVESSLPAVAFLVLFTVTKELNLSLIAALVAAAVFTLIRLVQGSKLVSALTGLVGVAICAFAAYRTGNASDYFVVGFWTNGLYSLAYLVSMAVRWPITGLIFGFIRGEGLAWRQNPVRVRQYMLATWIITILMLLRLVVQMPLYFANAVEALGATRLIMGLPLYALGVWLAWRVSAPARRSRARLLMPVRLKNLNHPRLPRKAVAPTAKTSKYVHPAHKHARGETFRNR